jgi:hypothetical protein
MGDFEMSKPCIHCSSLGGTVDKHHPQCVVAFAARGGGPAFVAVGKAIMRADEFIARARSHTMALRIANALNQYQPNRSGF